MPIKEPAVYKRFSNHKKKHNKSLYFNLINILMKAILLILYNKTVKYVGN